jgi:hypothetical protein
MPSSLSPAAIVANLPKAPKLVALEAELAGLREQRDACVDDDDARARIEFQIEEVRHSLLGPRGERCRSIGKALDPIRVSAARKALAGLAQLTEAIDTLDECSVEISRYGRVTPVTLPALDTLRTALQQIVED